MAVGGSGQRTGGGILSMSPLVKAITAIVIQHRHLETLKHNVVQSYKL